MISLLRMPPRLPRFSRLLLRMALERTQYDVNQHHVVVVLFDTLNPGVVRVDHPL